MTGRMLQLILGVVIFFCSTPAGMAQETIREELRADFLRPGMSWTTSWLSFSLNDEATLAEAESLEFGESETEVEESLKKDKKRYHGKRSFVSKIRVVTGFSKESLAKGEARHPLTQDARQQRTEMIRFLLLQALV